MIQQGTVLEIALWRKTVFKHETNDLTIRTITLPQRAIYAARATQTGEINTRLTQANAHYDSYRGLCGNRLAGLMRTL